MKVYPPNYYNRDYKYMNIRYDPELWLHTPRLCILFEFHGNCWVHRPIPPITIKQLSLF